MLPVATAFLRDFTMSSWLLISPTFLGRYFSTHGTERRGAGAGVALLEELEELEELELEELAAPAPPAPPAPPALLLLLAPSSSSMLHATELQARCWLGLALRFARAMRAACHFIFLAHSAVAPLPNMLPTTVRTVARRVRSARSIHGSGAWGIFCGRTGARQRPFAPAPHPALRSPALRDTHPQASASATPRAPSPRTLPSTRSRRT